MTRRDHLVYDGMRALDDELHDPRVALAMMLSPCWRGLPVGFIEQWWRARWRH